MAAVGAEAEAEAEEGLLDEVALSDEGAEATGALAQGLVFFGGHLGEDGGEVVEAFNGDAGMEVADNVADGGLIPHDDGDAATKVKRCFVGIVDAEVFARVAAATVH